MKNEELRARVVWLEGQESRLEGQLASIREDLRLQRDEQARLERQLADLESAGRRLSEQYVEVERQNTNLANLYVASYRLHSTLDRRELLEAIQEIIANLVGSEEVAIFEAEGSALRLVASFGINPGAYQRVVFGAGPIGLAASTGKVYLAEPDGRQRDGSCADAVITACVPLVLAGKVTGAIAIFRLLPQKPSLEAVDRELFEMLTTQAAQALYATTLHARLAPVLEAAW